MAENKLPSTHCTDPIRTGGQVGKRTCPYRSPLTLWLFKLQNSTQSDSNMWTTNRDRFVEIKATGRCGNSQYFAVLATAIS